MLKSRILIWLEFVFVVIPTTLGAAYVMSIIARIFMNLHLAFSYWDFLLVLVPFGIVYGILAIWVMFIAIIKQKPTSRFVIYGFAGGVVFVLAIAVIGLDREPYPWWTFPLMIFLNPGTPYILVGCHWLYLLHKSGGISNSLPPTTAATRGGD
jgi:hypothetical protein